MTNLSLPLPAEELPEGLRRFGDPNGPAPARAMAARGLVPVKGADLVTLLVQLSADSDATIAKSARDTLGGVPDGVLIGACSAALHPAILDGLVRQVIDRDDALSKLAQNPALADDTLIHLARNASENITEIIAVNQQRLLGVPKVIEALYHNRNTRMSTADRLVELAARNDVVLSGVKSFQEHVEAIKGELIPESSEEALPSDEGFKEALEADSNDSGSHRKGCRGRQRKPQGKVPPPSLPHRQHDHVRKSPTRRSRKRGRARHPRSRTEAARSDGRGSQHE